jgi:[protein-PII] uridylyltransferase
VSNDFRAVTEIVLYTPDNAGLFSQFAGAIAMSGGSIVDAKAFTTSDGFALDVFSVQDAEGGAFGDPQRLSRLAANIEKTLRGEVMPGQHLAKRNGQRSRASAFSIRPRIQLDNDASRIATVIEVECLDRPGLLYDMTQALFEAGLSISTSMISTYGERAVDVFYVRDGFGHKIVHPARLETVEKRLRAALAPPPLEAATPAKA